MPSPEDTVPPGEDGHTVLVVEDDRSVRELLAAALEAPGRRVLTASTGTAALALAADVEVDVLVTDVLLPGLNGPQIAAALRATRPSLGVVYLSGAFDQPGFPRPDDGPLLEKPFPLNELRSAVQAQLAKQSSA